jgi:DNA-binding transcriptional ArsR family regulator
MSLGHMDLADGPFDAISPDNASAVDAGVMGTMAESAAAFLKALSHEGRLMILCHLISGEKSVTELERLLDSRQAAVSQQLARLRLEGLVHARRDGKAIFYSIQDTKVHQTISLMHTMFCTKAD